jgi:hypothetical protein
MISHWYGRVSICRLNDLHIMLKFLRVGALLTKSCITHSQLSRHQVCLMQTPFSGSPSFIK